jgi:UDP-glucose 4-epimerase
MRILVTGGAGYIGSIVSEELLENGHHIVVVDNLTQGHRGAVLPGADFVLADICNSALLEDILKRFEIEAVIHLAGDSVVSESSVNPHKFFYNNVVGSISLLDGMLKQGIKKIIFSSSAAVYGESQTMPLTEEEPKVPTNAYGESKLMIEQVLARYGRAYNLKYACLRYFNAAGASGQLGEDHHPETHLIPLVLRAALSAKGPVEVFGTDYPTVDGTCIRDYIHVKDVARAHILALEKLEQSNNAVYNLGSQEGYSVLQVVKAAEKITGHNIPVKRSSRRTGDPARLVACSNRARQEMDWHPVSSDLESIITSAWKWMRNHPNGYEP